jgi:hypothetical protein
MRHLIKQFPIRRLKWAARLLTSLLLLAAGCNGGGGSTGGAVHFVPNSHQYWSNQKNWTTSYGPAYADISLGAGNFVPCRGGPYALCYYSGPNTGSQDLSCTLTGDGKYANCQCYDIPYGVYFVDINGILNHKVYEDTVAKCGVDGSACGTINSAPVCQQVNQGTLMPGASVYSTFSLECLPTNGIGITNCSDPAPYAGCMTAPCKKTDQPEIVQCSCPVYTGPYQVGQNDQACTLGSDLVWSAAYTPPSPTAVPTLDVSQHAEADEPIAAPAGPSPGGACLPDAPGGLGCPLYVPGVTAIPADAGIDCTKVCDEYDSCKGSAGAQAGYTCDATLCTDQCNDRDLVGPACSGLSGCDISEIVKTETAASCSCCASQLCGCSPSAKTNAAIAAVDQQQRDRMIKPQCDINGTLCGTP